MAALKLVDLYGTSAPETLTVEFKNLGTKRVTREQIGRRNFPLTLAGGVARAFEDLTTLGVPTAEGFVRRWVNSGEWNPSTNRLTLEIGWPERVQR